LDEILIPLKLVEEEGRLPLRRGPKALQEKGIPYYKLTQSGVLVALSIKEIQSKRLKIDILFWISFFHIQIHKKRNFRELF